MTIPYTNEDDDIANDEKEHLQKSEGQIPTRNVKPYKNENVADCKVSIIQLENSELCCEVDSRSVTFLRKCESIFVLWKSSFIIINHVFDFFTQLYHKAKFKSHLANSESMELFDKRYSGIEWIFDFIVKPIRRIPQFIYKTFPLFPKDYKSFFEDGYKKQTLDSLKVEAVRLATFSTFPSSACAYATKLASAGFYYNGNGDEVVCFNCGMKHRNWRNRDSPLEIHKQMSPNCSFVLEAIQEQIEDHKNRRVPVSYATGACGTTCELLPAENKQFLNKYFENGETYAQPSTSVPDTKIPKSEEANPTESSHLNLPLQNPSRNVNNSSSRNDIQSLIRIPQTDIAVNIATSYTNGYIPHDLPSRNAIGNIPHDLPSRNAIGNIPNDLPSRNAIGNIPNDLPSRNAIGNIPNDLPSRNAIGNIPNDLPSRNAIGNIPNDLPSRHLTRNESMVSKESMTMGVCIAKPKYPKYAIRATRLDSFKMWPRNMKQSPEELALAGFFFTGKLIWFQKLWKSIYLYISSYIHYLFVANDLIATNIS
jgi:hypothetical protein